MFMSSNTRRTYSVISSVNPPPSVTAREEEAAVVWWGLEAGVTTARSGANQRQCVGNSVTGTPLLLEQEQHAIVSV